MSRILIVLAVGLGWLLAYVDSRPTWNDTGVMAGALFLSCGSLAFMSPERPWLWALLMGIWIPAANILLSQNASSLLALAFAFAGAYAGAGIRRAVMIGDAVNSP